MTGYLLKRLWHVVITLIGISVISFFLMQLAPGGPVDRITDLNPHITPETKERFRKDLGLDRPIWIQYGRWVKKIATLDFGVSYNDNRPVIHKIAERLPATLLLNVLTIGVIWLLAIPIGWLSAVRAGTWFDRAAAVFVFIGFSVPGYALALGLMMWFGMHLGWLPISGLVSIHAEEFTLLEQAADMARHLALPVLVLGLTSLAGLSRYMRQSLLEILHQDFIRAALAKGLTPWRVYGVHAVRNALIPLITIFGLMLPELIGGAVIIETIFAYPGIGRLGYDAIMTRDYNLVMALIVITSALTVLGNLVADLLYGWADPRVRYR